MAICETGSVAADDLRSDRKVVPSNMATQMASQVNSPSASGQWTAEREHKSDRVWLQFLRSGQDGIWVPLPSGITSGQDIRFELRRDAGIFSFNGSFDGSDRNPRGGGFFTFRPDPEYRSEMSSLGYPGMSAGQSLELAMRDVTLGFVRELGKLGYLDLGIDTLLELRAHDVSPEFLRQLAVLGYRNLPASRLVEFRMYDVSPALIRELAALHYHGLSAGRLVEFRIQDVTPKFIRELATLGYRDLPAEKLLEMRVQGVDDEFIRQLNRQGRGKLSPEDLIQMAIARSAGAASQRGSLGRR
jgi:hypothetical protein